MFRIDAGSGVPVADPTRDIQRGFGLLGQPYTLVYDRQGRKAQDYAGATFAEDSPPLSPFADWD